jgi:hypothetical protein
MKEYYPDRVYIIRYEELVTNTIVEIRELFDFCNLQINNSTLDFIRLSKSIDDSDHYGVLKIRQNADVYNYAIPKEIELEIRNELKDSHLSQFLE